MFQYIYKPYAKTNKDQKFIYMFFFFTEKAFQVFLTHFES